MLNDQSFTTHISLAVGLCLDILVAGCGNLRVCLVACHVFSGGTVVIGVCSRSLVGSRHPALAAIWSESTPYEYPHQEDLPLSIRPKRSLTRSIVALLAATLVASVLALVAGPASAVTPINKSSLTSADGRVSGADRYGTATAAASAYLTRRGSLRSEEPTSELQSQ